MRRSKGLDMDKMRSKTVVSGNTSAEGKAEKGQKGHRKVQHGKSDPGLQNMSLAFISEDRAVNHSSRDSSPSQNTGTGISRHRYSSEGDRRPSRPMTVINGKLVERQLINLERPDYLKKIAICGPGDTIFYEFDQVCARLIVSCYNFQYLLFHMQLDTYPLLAKFLK